MKRLRNERGNVLLYTLIASIVATVLAISLVQLLMARAAASARVTAQTAAQRQAEASLSVAFNTWNAGGVCAPLTGYTCVGACTAGTCGCTYRPNACTCVNGGYPDAPTAGTGTNPAACPASVVATTVSGRCQVQAKTCP